MKFWCIKDAIDSPSTVRTTPCLDTNVWKTLVPRYESRTPLRPKTIGRAGGKPVDTQNQVLAIMKYQFFWKQAYQGTGSQRYSSEEVTDSIQMGLHPYPTCLVIGVRSPGGAPWWCNLPGKERTAEFGSREGQRFDDRGLGSPSEVHLSRRPDIYTSLRSLSSSPLKEFAPPPRFGR